MPANLEYALKYLEKGYSVIPLNPSENDALGKKPFIPWAEFQRRRPSEEEIKSWWDKWPNAMIGLVCGQISGFMVMDTDTLEQDEELQSYLPESIIPPIARTPSGGKHYYFKFALGIRNSNGTSGYGFHVRGEGGYVVAPPSQRTKKGVYAWLDGIDPEKVSIPEAPKMLIEVLLKQGFELGGGIGGGNDKKEPQYTTLTTTNHNYFEFGRRDNSLFHAANLMTKAGGEPDFVCEVLERLIVSWGEPPDKRWIDAKVKSALERVERKERNIADEVFEFVMTTTGTTFSTTDTHNALQTATKNEKKAVVMALSRLKDKGIIEKWGNKHGNYMMVDKDLEEIDWEHADDTPLKLELPFDIHRWVEIMPKNIVVIAGVPNAGKTAFLLNTAIMNVDTWTIRYLSSEMDGDELKKRIKRFEDPEKKWKAVKFFKREQDFVKAIDPNGMNIIDFLEITDKFYLIAERLREYHSKLEKGVLFVAIQKDPNKDYGRGGGMGMEKPRLYINIDKGKLKIAKAKNWATEFNPNGMEWKFKLVGGSKFIIQFE